MNVWLFVKHFGPFAFINDVGYHAICENVKEYKWIPIKEGREDDKDKNSEIFTFKDFSDKEVKYVKTFSDYSNPAIYRRTNWHIQELSVSNPGFLVKPEKYRDREPNVMYFDIETESIGRGLPTADKNPILLIGYQINDEQPVVLNSLEAYYKFLDEGRSEEYFPDYDMVKAFANVICSRKIDILVGYNSNSFDLPYILSRMRMFGMDTKKLAKDGTANIFSYESAKKQHELACRGIFTKRERLLDQSFLIPGRVLYDIYEHSVLTDTSLSGMPNLKMKTLAEKFEIEAIELERHEVSNTSELARKNPERFVEYLESDVNITKRLGKMYLEREVALAEVIGLPLNVTLERGKGTIAAVGSERAFYKSGYKVIDINRDRYSFLLSGRQRGDKLYEGAHVHLYKKGRFDKIVKADVGAQYPSAMITFNLSPETTRIAKNKDGSYKILPYTNSSPKFEWNKDRSKLYITLSDATLHNDFVVEIDQYREGVLTSFLKEVGIERDRYKELAKEKEGTAEGSMAKSFSDALKVIRNSIYGLQGNERATSASVIVAFTITAMCRWMIKEVIEHIDGKLKPEDRKVIECDTDGIYISGDIDIKDINKFINKLILGKAGVKENHFIMEKDEYGCGYFYAQKNYILEKIDKDGNFKGYEKKGSALKGRRTSGVERRAVDLMIDSVLGQKMSYEEAKRLAFDIEKLDSEMFTFYLKLKDEKDYHRSVSSARDKMHLIGRMKEVMGRAPETSELIEIYHSRASKYSLDLAEVITHDNINFRQYKKRIQKIVDIFKYGAKDDFALF